ncbi:tripartite tricarboxylate transporter substrate binding protein [Bradyrhizobium manausense]|uniref:Bug family tripartite tricarboxylate transporter substrate binding protein n=1 Tax=Bradyrhizobium manausense TaxID=989370 RepID=UPI001BA9F3A5|nr:tripartite tricarboxylate transporter substrate binding protein [Bradyrhizobium manausense]MBR0687822.1 tripartite tricarboxylate transporter substrate binding protein [Bradyrhizobium manausense]
MTIARTKRKLILLSAAAALSATFVFSGGALAQNYPAKLITFVVPFPAGGTSDTMARFIAQELNKSLGQPVVIENRPGANGNIGSGTVARAAPDGYTLVLSGVGSHAINAGIYRKMPYDPVKDFTHISLISSGPNAIVVNPSFPAKTLPELIALARKDPGKYDYASSGVGSSGNMAMELFKLRAGIKIEHIPYKGGAPALTDVLGGQVPILITNADAVLSNVQSGQLRILAVTSSRRNEMYPDTPTIAELGYEDVNAVSWTGVSGPANMPNDVVSKLQQVIAAAVNGPLKPKLDASGLTPGGNRPEEFTNFVASEVAKWSTVAKSAGIAVE